MTNFDKIKQMSLEEFAHEFLIGLYMCERCDFEFNSLNCKYGSCRDGYIEYLKREAEENESI